MNYSLPNPALGLLENMAMMTARRKPQRILSKILPVLFGLVLLGSSCKSDLNPSANQPLALLAAASTTNAVEEIVSMFTTETGLVVQCNFAASSALARQIEAGAEADVFLSANLQWMDYLVKNHLVQERKNLLRNRLVLIVPKTSTVKIENLQALTADSITHIALAEVESVPAGIYARQCLEKAGCWDAIRAKVVQAGDVRQALALVERGEVDAGIVYCTDAQISSQIQTLFPLDESLYDTPCYPVALLRSTLSRPEAKQLFAFLQSGKARKVFEQYGFQMESSIEE